MQRIDKLKKIRIKIFKIYLFLLPIRMLNIAVPVQSIFGTMANYTSFIFHLVGMFLIFLSIKKINIKMDKLIMTIVISILILNISSILMATILYQKLGVLYGETTYDAILGQIIYFIHILTMFLYNYISFKEISINEIKNILDKVIIYILAIGYIQIIVLMNIPIFNKIYDMIDIFNILSDSTYLLRLDRITLTGAEPASAGILLGVLIMPYILGNMIEQRKYKSYRTIFLTYLPLIYYTKSSTTYMVFVINIIIYIVYLVKNNKSAIKTCIYTLTFTTLILIIILYNMNSLKTINFTSGIDEVYYLLVEKVTDKDNLSTVHRSTTLINDVKVFIKYPILGAGNGNQGFYYNENIPNHALRSVETRSIYNGEQGIINGGPFVPAYISGYGIIGILIFIKFLIRCKKQINLLRGKYLYYMYTIGGMGFLVAACMSTDIVGNYFIIFIASIPFLKDNLEK